MMVQLKRPRWRFHNPAKQNGSCERRLKRTGRFFFSPGTARHSKNAVAGTRQRCRSSAPRQAGVSSLSSRALKGRSGGFPGLGSLQLPRKPQEARCSSGGLFRW